MSESSQSAARSPKDPVRIVYHAGNRTFARLFNERSLGEIKDVVRRKLGLGSETDVSLKQIGAGTLLDLEDDGDFQAFRVLLKSSVSVDIQVTVGRSQGSTLPPVALQPQEHPSPGKTITTTSSVSPSGESVGVVTPGQPAAHPEVAPVTEASITPAKTPLARKRKVSFDVVTTPSDKPTEQRALGVAITADASAKSAESPAASKVVGAEEPPKKKQRKESTKKEVKTTATVESPATKPSASKPKTKKSTTSDRGSKAETGAPKDTETSEPPAKKPRKQKKDDSTKSKKSSAPVNQDNNEADVTSCDPGEVGSLRIIHVLTESEVPKGLIKHISSYKDEKTKTLKGTACAAIPKTSASTSVLSEVAAAILSGYLSKASETIPPELPAKRKPVKRSTKKPSATSSALPTEHPTMLADKIPNVPTDHRLEQVILSNEPPPQTPDLIVPRCPICLEKPFHIRYYCPIVLKGPDAIQERLEEIKRTNTGDQQSLIKQLEGLLRDAKVTSEPSLNATPTDDVQSPKVSSPPNASLPRTPTIPSNSYLSEVTVESKDEGSSSESFDDDVSEGGAKHRESSVPQGQKTPDEQPLPSNDDLEAIIRGPAPKRYNILHLVDRIIREEENSDSEEDKAELEQDLDEETGRSRRRPSMRITRSSDSESDDEEFWPPSPLRSAEDTSNNLPPGVQCSNKFAKESDEHQEDDVVMKDPVDPLVREEQEERHDDNNEKTHVGSEDHMVVDESTGEKDIAIAVEEPSSPARRASLPPTTDVPNNEPQEAEATPSRDSTQLVSSEVLVEAEADPIEPADEFAPPDASRLLNPDPIEAPSEDIESLFASATQSTPKPGVSKRIKTRNGEILEDEADQPVLVEQLAVEATDNATPVPAKGKLRKKVTDTTASQGSVPRRSPRFNSVPPATSTPTPVVLLTHKAKSGARTSKALAAKTPAKQTEERSDALKSSAKDGVKQNGAHVTPTPSLVRWETMTEPSSPSLQPDESSMLVDELISNSQTDDDPIRVRPNAKEKKGRAHKPAIINPAESTQEIERLFDLTSSQIPFPYSQHLGNLAPAVSPNGKENEGTTDSEEEPKVGEKRTRTPARYRSLSQLASQATLFSPSLPTPASKSMTNGKAKKYVEDSSSSSSSDEDGVNGSEHIPRGRRAGAVLKTKKRKSLLSRI